MNPVPLVLLFLAIVLVIRLFAGVLDSDRVRAYVESEGGELLAKHWTPFGRGWFGSQNERIYRVRYRDADGSVHDATCKTSAMAGVYFTEDRIVEESPRKVGGGLRKSREELEAENRALREEVERLKGGRS